MANQSICSIEECGKHARARGFCTAHYKRFLKHGDPLRGGTPRGEPLRFIHEVAVYYQDSDCLIWPYGNGSDGYARVYVDGKDAVASRYICELINGEPPTPEHEAAHSCGKGHLACIAPNHLLWKTHTANMADKIIHGTHNRGVRNGQTKLSEIQVREIIRLRGKETQKSIADAYGVSSVAISKIHTGKTWLWLK